MNARNRAAIFIALTERQQMHHHRRPHRAKDSFGFNQLRFAVYCYNQLRSSPICESKQGRALNAITCAVRLPVVFRLRVHFRARVVFSCILIVGVIKSHLFLH